MIPLPPKLTRQRNLSEEEGEQLLKRNLLECRALALRQHAKHPIIKHMRIMRILRYDTYFSIMNYLGEIQYIANHTPPNINRVQWQQVPRNMVFPLVRILRRYIDDAVYYDCNYNVVFTLCPDKMEPIFKNPYLFPHITALSPHTLGWDVV